MIKNVLLRLPKDTLEDAAQSLMENFDVGLDGLVFELRESRINKDYAWFIMVDPGKVDPELWEAQMAANIRHTFWGFPWAKLWEKYP